MTTKLTEGQIGAIKTELVSNIYDCCSIYKIAIALKFPFEKGEAWSDEMRRAFKRKLMSLSIQRLKQILDADKYYSKKCYTPYM